MTITKLINPRGKSYRELKNFVLGSDINWEWLPQSTGQLQDCFDEEDLKDYFEENIDSPYMLYSQTVKKDKRDKIPAITHVDNTCRIQTVDHGFLSLLLEEYYKISGVPVLLNTSFNDSGKPIVETPQDAIDAFLNMNIDYLVMNNTIIGK